MHRTHRLIGLLLLSVVVHALLLLLLPGDGSWVEAVYARRIYPAVAPVFAWLPSLVPFSVIGVLIAALLVWLPAYPILNFLRWRRGRLGSWQAARRTLLAWLVVVAFVFHAGYFLTGYNYLRPPLEERIGLRPAALSPEQFLAAARHFVRATVEARVPVPAWDPAELDGLVDEAMDRAVRELEGRPPPVVSPLKSDLNTGILALAGYRGVASPITFEAHVDFELPPHLLAFTAAHEKAHLAGFLRERDANFVAWYALRLSDDARLRYAGYFGLVRYFFNGETRALAVPLIDDFAQVERYRASKVSRPLQRSASRVYDVYLRANRMEDGRGDYARVSGLVAAWLIQAGEVDAAAAAAD